MSPAAGQITVTVPATSANLGPGFDSFGLALELRNRFTARLSDEWSVSVTGEGAGVLPESEENAVARAMAGIFAAAGMPGQAAEVSCENHIPAGEGLGSSAAAIVGGIVLATALAGIDRSTGESLQLAAAIEGHPDNVAAALLGGFTVAWDDGAVRAKRIEPACGLAAIVVASDLPLATVVSRGLLPSEVPHASAAFNAARAGILAAGMALGDAAAIAAGLSDRIHEPYRHPAVPDIDAIREVFIAHGALGAVLSGAGPTVIALVAGGDDAAAVERARRVCTDAAPALARFGGRRSPRVLRIDRAGACTG